MTEAQSVYQHEAQEYSGSLNFSTFLYALVILIPLLIIFLFVGSYVKDKQLKEEKERKEREKKRKRRRTITI